MNSKEEQTNSEVTNLENESFIEQKKDPNYINEQIGNNKLDEKSIEIKDEYKFGWSSYSEITNGRFAILDEATSALDINTEKKLYSLLKERELSLISVGHRPSLKDFHENILELNGQGDWKLLTSDKYLSLIHI